VSSSTEQSQSASNSGATLLLASASLIWGAHAVAGQLAVGHIQPLLIVFLRWAIVGTVLSVMYGKQVREHWHLIRPKLVLTVISATIGFTCFNALFYFASERTSGLNVGILQGTIPIFVLAGTVLFHKATVSAIQIVGAIIAFLGLLVVATAGQPLAILDLQVNSGDALMILACACYALYTLSLKNRPQVPGTVFFTVLAVCAAFAAIPFVVFEASTAGLTMPSAQGWWVVLFVAIFPSCLAQLFFLWGVDRVGPGRAGVYVNLVPVFAAFLAVLVLSESFHLYHAIALVLVVSGIWLVQRAPSQ